jgi:hypothetical protein
MARLGHRAKSPFAPLFGALEGIWMNDRSTTVAAKGGLRGVLMRRARFSLASAVGRAD